MDLGTTYYATLETDDGEEIEVRGVFYPGSPEVPPAYSHGGLPADPPELDAVEAHVAGRWIDVSDIDWISEEQARDLLWESACDAARD